MAISGLHNLTAVLTFVTAACFIGGLAGVRINTSSSLPLGLYVKTASAAEDLIEFCPAEPYASVSSKRSYRTPGLSCPDRAVPLLKPVVARAGDIVEVSAQGIAVNGQLLPNTAPLPADVAGRVLTAWPEGSYAVRRGTVWVASTHSRGSYDSRYMGPIDIRLIRGRLRPLWVW